MRVTGSNLILGYLELYLLQFRKIDSAVFQELLLLASSSCYCAKLSCFFVCFVLFWLEVVLFVASLFKAVGRRPDSFFKP